MKSEEEQGTHASNEEISSEASRAEEHGEADEPDAPTSGEENQGMSTILDASPLAGVQDDESQK